MQILYKDITISFVSFLNKILLSKAEKEKRTK